MEKKHSESFIGDLHLDEPHGQPSVEYKLNKIIRETKSIVEKHSERYARRIKQKVDNEARMLEKLSKLFHEIEKRSVDLEPDIAAKIVSSIEHAQKDEDVNYSSGSGEGKK